MRRLIPSVLFFFVLVLTVSAQQNSTAPKKAATPAQSTPGTAAQTRIANLPSVATVESFLKHTFGYDSIITWQVLGIAPSRAQGVADVTVLLKNAQGQQAVHLYVLPGEKYAVVGDMMPFGADPFAPARAEIASRANGPSRGPANSPVTIVEFSDLECPSCKAAQPVVDRLLGDEPDVHFIFQNFPLEHIHPWAFLGATYADCVGRENNAAFWKFIESVYASQEQITALLPQNAANPETAMKQASPAIAKKLQELAGAAGANPQQVAACSAEPATAARVRKSLELGEALEVTGTPTLYINGRRLQNLNGIPYEVLKSMVDTAKSGK
jgi:protein-disulfide isomerase